jgi:hypothetical protein
MMGCDVKLIAFFLDLAQYKELVVDLPDWNPAW